MTKRRREARHRSPCGGNTDQPCQRRQGEAEPARHASHDFPLSRRGKVGGLHRQEYLQSEHTLCPRQGTESW